MWPTPRSSDGNGTGSHGTGGPDLRTSVQSWPTPGATAWHSTGNRGKVKENAESEEQYRQMTAGNVGQLNAQFVEWLMGLPCDYTVTDGPPDRDIDPDQWADGEWPGVPRVIVGQTNRVNRLKCLGNAVLPQCAYFVGRMILDMESGRADGEED